MKSQRQSPLDMISSLTKVPTESSTALVLVKSAFYSLEKCSYQTNHVMLWCPLLDLGTVSEE